MFEWIVGLALLPAAVITALWLVSMLTVLVISTWRILLTLLIFIVIAYNLATLTTNLEKWIMLAFMFLALLYVWAGAFGTSVSVQQNNQVTDNDISLEEVVAFMKIKNRFTVKDVKNKFSIKNTVKAREIIDHVQSSGIIEPEDGLSLHWRYIDR